MSRQVPLPFAIWGGLSLSWIWPAVQYGSRMGLTLLVLGTSLLSVGAVCIVLWEIHGRTEKARAAKAAVDEKDGEETRLFQRSVLTRLDGIQLELEDARAGRATAGVHLDERLNDLSAQLDDTQTRMLAALSDAYVDAVAARENAPGNRPALVQVNGLRNGRHS